MSKRILEIRFSREQRINDHDIDRFTLYCNGKAVYYARYESCVINYINENYAKKSQVRLQKKLDLLSKKYMRMRKQVDEIQEALAKPLVKVTGLGK